MQAVKCSCGGDCLPSLGGSANRIWICTECGAVQPVRRQEIQAWESQAMIGGFA